MTATPYTLNDLRRARSDGRKVSMLTCYDYTTARVLQEAGVEILLVGDSASNVILGHESTLPIELDLLVELTRAVTRGAPRCLVVGDMPFGSYHDSVSVGVRRCAKMLKKSQCDIIKLEVTRSHIRLVHKLADAGIAVMAHIGLRPQAVGVMGGYKFQGRTYAEAMELVDLAVELQNAGAVSILIEAVPPEVSERIVEEVRVPVIGCGAGPACDGHVVVLQDLLQQTPQQPKFVPRWDSTQSLSRLAKQYVDMIHSGQYPAAEHCYVMPDQEKSQFLSDARRE